MAVGAWFATAFDEPVACPSPPFTVSTGRDPAIRAADHFIRGRRIVGRFSDRAGMFGLKVAAADGPLRVRLRIRLDLKADQLRREKLGGTAVDLGLPRLAIVRSQGRPRGAILLARGGRSSAAGDASAIVVFDVASSELPADGLLLVELADPGPALPGWAGSQCAVASPIGLRVERVEVVPVPPAEPMGGAQGAGTVQGAGTAQLSGLVSAGGLLGSVEKANAGPLRSGLVVVNPAGSALRCRLRVRTRPVRRRTGPVGRVWQLLRQPLIGLPAGRLTVRAVDLPDGRPVEVGVAAVGRDIEVVLPSTVDHPVLVGVETSRHLPASHRLVCCPVESRDAEPPA